MIVLDASAAVHALTGFRPQGEWVRERLEATEAEVHAPHLIDVEVASALRRLVAGGAITDGRAEALLAALHDMPLRRYPHFPLLTAIWRHRHRLTAMDAAYVALAEALDATLLTTDPRLGRAGLGARVEAFRT